jgi:hypothetical protein
MKTFFSVMLLCVLLVSLSCTKEDTTPVTPTPTTVTKSSAKAITKFSFAALSPAVEGAISSTTITATVPASTDVTKLVPTITISDKATVSPASSVAQDFSKDVTYTVTAEDGSKQEYKVSVTKATSSTGTGQALAFTEKAALPTNPDINISDPENGLVMVGDKIYYLAKSKDSKEDKLKYVYEYSIGTNTWLKKSDMNYNFPTGDTRNIFAYNNKIYVVIFRTAQDGYSIIEADLSKDPYAIALSTSIGGGSQGQDVLFSDAKIYFSKFRSNSTTLTVADLSSAKLSNATISYPGTLPSFANSDNYLLTIVSNKSFYVFGKKNKSGDVLNPFELYKLTDIATNKWEKKTPPKFEGNYFYPSVFSIGKKLFVQDNSQLFVLETESDKWTLISKYQDIKVNTSYFVSDENVGYFLSTNNKFYLLK